MIYTYYTNISSISWHEIEDLLQFIDYRLIENILSRKNNIDRCASLIGKLIILYNLNRFNFYYKLPNIEFMELGKPYFADIPNLNFNISHSHDVVGCSFSVDAPVGLDIECMNHVDTNEYYEIFSRDELLYMDKNNNVASFYKIWCLKEAALKTSGIGLFCDLKNINTLNFPITIGNTSFYYHIHTINNYFFAIVSAIEQLNKLVHLNINDIVAFFKVRKTKQPFISR